MGILWAGQEDIEFPYGTWPVLQSAYMGHARNSLTSGNWISYPPTYPPCIGPTFPGGSVSSLWLSSRAGGYVTNASANLMLFGLTHSSKGMGEGLWLVVDNPISRLALCTWNGSAISELAYDANNSTSVSGAYHIDMQVVNYGANGNVYVYINQQLAFSYNGNVAISGLTALDRVAFYGDNVNARWVFSEFIVADEDTRLFRLAPLFPSGNGNTNNMNSGNYADIDETTNSDADVVNANAANQVIQVACNNTPSGIWQPRAVIMTARACKSADSTPGNLQLGVLSGANNSDGDSQAVSTAYASYQRLMATNNPVTGNAWTQAEVDALQLQIKAVA